MDNVSNSESEGNSHPAPQSCQYEAPAAQDTIVVNNPEITASKGTAAADIHYFFQKNEG